MYQNGKIMLSQIETFIRQGVFTPTKRVDLDTFLCITELTAHGKAYYQGEFNTMPEQQRAMFYGRTVGESFGNWKLVAVFDVWPEAMVNPNVTIPRN